MTHKSNPTITEGNCHEIAIKTFNGDSIFDILSSISSHLSLNDALSSIVENIQISLNGEICLVFLYNSDSNMLEVPEVLKEEDSFFCSLKKKASLDIGQGIAGMVAQSKKPLLVKDAQSEGNLCLIADRIAGVPSRSLVASPMIGERGFTGVIEVLNPQEKESFEESDLELLNILSKHAAIAIENAMFHEKTLYRESSERERLKLGIDIAMALLRNFLPESSVYERGGIKITAFNISASEIGGDIYDILEPEGDKVSALIGDVSGKGVSAALYMVKALGDFRWLASRTDSTEVMLKRLNGLLSNAPRGMFLTALHMLIDVHTGELQLSSAGHPPFLHFTSDEVKVVEIPSGLPLGTFPSPYPPSNISLGIGEKMLFFTDGVFDALNAKGLRLGFDGFVKYVRDHRYDEDIIDGIFSYINEFSMGAVKADDLTLLELRRLAV